jgi:hypothetical protein
MALSPTVPTRDDDPPHPNFDGIYFQATTDRTGVVAMPMSAQNAPPVSFLPLPVAINLAAEISDQIIRIRRVDPASYLATYLEDMLDDFTDAIEACRPTPKDT